MFNGTSKRQPGEFDRAMEAQGGANNAFTSDDVTVYQDWIPKSALDLVFDLESDRLANLVLRPAGDRERARRGVFRAPPAHRGQQRGIPLRAGAGDGVRRASLPDSHHRLAGRHPELEARGPAEVLQDLLRAQQLHAGAGGRRRAPTRCSRWRRNTSSPIPRQEPPPPVRTTEPEQLGEKRVYVQRNAQTPLLYAAYKSPAANDRAGPGHQPADVDPHRRRRVATASPAGRRKETGHRGRRAPSRKASIRVSPG